MSETAQAFAWTVSTMKADSALVAAAPGGVFQGFADINTTAPYALVIQQGGTDTITANAKRLFVRLLMQIKAVGPAKNFAALVTIADRVDALFGRVGNVSLSPGWLLCSYREQPLSYEEIVSGTTWSHLGGIYRISLQGS